MKLHLLLILILLGLMYNCGFKSRQGADTNKYEYPELMCINQNLSGLGIKTTFKVQGNEFICISEKNNLFGKETFTDTIKTGNFSDSSWIKIDSILYTCPKEIYNTNAGIMSGAIQLITVKMEYAEEWNFTLHNGHDDKAAAIFNVLNENLDNYEFKTMGQWLEETKEKTD